MSSYWIKQTENRVASVANKKKTKSCPRRYIDFQPTKEQTRRIHSPLKQFVVTNEGQTEVKICRSTTPSLSVLHFWLLDHVLVKTHLLSSPELSVSMKLKADIIGLVPSDDKPTPFRNE